MQSSISHMHTLEYSINDDDYIFIIIMLILIDLSNEPEYTCEICGRVYKQETRYNTHIREHTQIQTIMQPCIADTIQHTRMDESGRVVNKSEIQSNDIIMELLKQNRDMMDMIKQQQETISLLIRHSKIIS